MSLLPTTFRPREIARANREDRDAREATGTNVLPPQTFRFDLPSPVVTSIRLSLSTRRQMLLARVGEAKSRLAQFELTGDELCARIQRVLIANDESELQELDVAKAAFSTLTPVIRKPS